MQITRPRTLCAGPRPRGEFWPVWLDRFSISRWTRCALANGGDAGHVVVDIRLAKQCRDGVLRRLGGHDRDLAPDTRKHERARDRQQSDRQQSGAWTGSGHTGP